MKFPTFIEDVSFTSSPSTLLTKANAAPQLSRDWDRLKQLRADAVSNQRKLIDNVTTKRKPLDPRSVIQALQDPITTLTLAGACLLGGFPSFDKRTVALYLAIAQNESGLNPYSRNEVGNTKASGLFQVTDTNGRAQLRQLSSVANTLMASLSPQLAQDLDLQAKHASTFSLYDADPAVQIAIAPTYLRDNHLALGAFAQWIPDSRFDYWGKGKWHLTNKTKAKWIISDVKNPANKVIFTDYYAGAVYFMSILHVDGPGGFMGISYVNGKPKVTGKPNYPGRAMKDVATYGAILGSFERKLSHVIEDYMEQVTGINGEMIGKFKGVSDKINQLIYDAAS